VEIFKTTDTIDGEFSTLGNQLRRHISGANAFMKYTEKLKARKTVDIKEDE
jgi:hypothetical protein